MIRAHPDTGRKGVYVNRAFTRYIIGMERTESDQLLETLYRQAWYPEYQCRFRWAKNSIAFWDNRACQHYATSDYWPHTRRVERVTIVGDRPFYQADATVAKPYQVDPDNTPFRRQLMRKRQARH